MDEVCQHQWHEMHHFGDNPGNPETLLHYCPTGFNQCNLCGETGLEPNPKCFKWGVPDAVDVDVEECICVEWDGNGLSVCGVPCPIHSKKS